MSAGLVNVAFDSWLDQHSSIVSHILHTGHKVRSLCYYYLSVCSCVCYFTRSRRPILTMLVSACAWKTIIFQCNFEQHWSEHVGLTSDKLLGFSLLTHKDRWRMYHFWICSYFTFIHWMYHFFDYSTFCISWNTRFYVWDPRGCVAILSDLRSLVLLRWTYVMYGQSCGVWPLAVVG